MSTSQRTFNQVKGILSKLDQRIDTLRSARLNDRLVGGAAATPLTAGATGATGSSFVGSIPMNTTIGTGSVGKVTTPTNPIAATSTTTPGSMTNTVAANAAAAASASKSVYGRATPIRPSGT
jgi:hypothetical protein